MWATPWWLQVANLPGVRRVEFHHCMHGSRRKKLTCLLTNCEALGSLAYSATGAMLMSRGRPRRWKAGGSSTQLQKLHTPSCCAGAWPAPWPLRCRSEAAQEQGRAEMARPLCQRLLA